MFAQTVITPELLSGLDNAVLADLFGAINPEKSPQGFEALVHKVVRQAMDVAVDFERKAQRGGLCACEVRCAVRSACCAGTSAADRRGRAAHSAAAASCSARGAARSGRTLSRRRPTPALHHPPASASSRAAAPGGPQLSQSLLDALERSEAQAVSSGRD